jgi:hypothetical protein
MSCGKVYLLIYVATVRHKMVIDIKFIIYLIFLKKARKEVEMDLSQPTIGHRHYVN